MISWHRYIDDVLMLWDADVSLLEEFLLALNSIYFNLKLTASFDQKSVMFLDVTISVQEDGKIATTLYCKPSSRNTLLHATSFHQATLVRSIPHSQYLHLRRNCSDDGD